ncbi:MAG: PQQ-dependent dehydrogenase, methanol/ethanol family [Gemmatimonadales bacterium]
MRAAVAVVLLLAACGRATHDYAITEQSQPFSDLNEAKAASAPPVVQQVTAQRIAAARNEPQNWLTYHGSYYAQRFSPLDQINAGNIKDLRVAWIFQSGVIGLVANPATYGFEATPIVVDGVMFVTGYDGYVWALDAVSGRLLWQYRHAIPLDVPLCCGNVNRGVAVAEGKVFAATQNGHLVALDASTGKPVWDKPFVDIRAGESATLAPLVVKDMVIVGSSGAEYGVRGHIDAFKLESGERVWRRYTIPKPGEAGSETWQDKEKTAWQRGGGAAWITGSYDPELDLLYWGTANPGPDFDGSVRTGDNLYTNSVLALDPDDGAIKWHYQWTPHDVWDYDGVNENILFDQDGRKLLGHFDKNGFLFVLDRSNGKLVRASPFARVTWGTIDPTSGAVSVKLRPTTEGVEICPGPAGAKEWPHAAYSPVSKLLYTPVVEQCGVFSTRKAEFKESMPYWGGAVDNRRIDGWGHVKAIDPLTGREVWSWKSPHPMLSSLLATGGDLVFAGQASGEFAAFHARTGNLLWQFQTGNGIHGSPIAYSVGGKEYIAIPTGWGGWIKGFAPEMYGAPRGHALIVFALP